MTLLRLHVRADQVSAVVVAPDAGPVGGSSEPLAGEPGPGGTTLVAAGDLWRAVLAVAGAAVAELAGPPTGLGVSAVADSLAVWDEETLGAARPVAFGVDVVQELTALATGEPHSWTHLLDGRYVVGGAASYLVARLTRGVHHVSGSDWAAEADLLPLGLPPTALPAPAGTSPVGVSDPGTFLGLALPVVVLGRRPSGR